MTTIEIRREVEAEILRRLRMEHHDLFWRSTSQEWQVHGGAPESMRDSDASYIYALADYIAGGRKSSPSDYAYRVKTNEATGLERLRIIQKTARQVRRDTVTTREP